MILEKVITIIADELKVDKGEITLQTNLQDDLGADSLDAVEIMMAIEDNFNISIPDNVSVNMKTVNDIVNYLKLNQ